MRALAVPLLAAVLFLASGRLAAAGEPAPWILVPTAAGNVWVPLGSVVRPFAPPAPGAPQAPGVPAVPPAASLESALANGALVRVDARPPGSAIAVDGRDVVTAPDAGSAALLALPPGVHVLELVAQGGSAFRLTIEVRASSPSGYQVVPRP